MKRWVVLCRRHLQLLCQCFFFIDDLVIEINNFKVITDGLKKKISQENRGKHSRFCDLYCFLKTFLKKKTIQTTRKIHKLSRDKSN